MTLTNGKIGSISDLVEFSTRQQEGDEAAVKAVYSDAKIGRDHHSAYYAFTKKGAGGRISGYMGSEALAWSDARSKLLATVQP